MRYFISLTRTGSITKSAELHHISPAAFSKAMRVFEEEIGHELTLPSGRGLMLTDYAKLIAPSIEVILQQIDRVQSGALHSNSNESLLRVATFEVFSTYFMTKTLKTYFANHSCEVHEAISGKMEELLAMGKVDLALTYLPIPHPDLDHLKVIEIEMGIFGKRQIFEKYEFSALPFAIPISPVEGSPNKVRGLDG